MGRQLLALARTVAAIAAGLLVIPTQAVALPPAETPTVPVMVVLDASGSMNQADAPGPRIDAAKTAVNNLVAALPADAQVGLTVYGTGTGSSDAEKDAGCRDIQTLVPVGPLDRAALTGAVDAVVASGYTPIGNALRAAADALPSEGPRSIVLVSDGEDTCAPPAPCDVAKELEQQGVDLAVHTVGFKVDQTARDQLSCIADATGGTYTDAADAGQLEQAMQVKVDYAITGYQAQGTPVTGADYPSTAAPLLRPGQYLDSYAVGDTEPGKREGTVKYYTVAVYEASTLYVSATIAPPTTPATSTAWEAKGFGVNLVVRDAEDHRCADADDSSVFNSVIQEPVTGVLAAEVGSSSWNPCPVDGVVILELQRSGDAFYSEALPVELVVRLEPPADAAGVAPAETEESEPLPEMAHGDAPTPIAAGNSFNDAADLTSGVTYSDSIVTGESRYYKIPLGWGQRLHYTVTEVGPPAPALQGGRAVNFDVFNPVRQLVSDYLASESWFRDRASDTFTDSTRFPARYTNRDDAGASGFSLDGFYYLRLNANLSDSASSTTFLLTVEVVGEPEAGPVYQPLGSANTSATAAPSSGLTTSAAAASSTSSASAATISSDAGAAVAAASPTGSRTSLSAASGDSGTSSAWLYGVGAVVAILGGAGTLFALWWGRRRSSSVH